MDDTHVDGTTGSWAIGFDQRAFDTIKADMAKLPAARRDAVAARWFAMTKPEKGALIRDLHAAHPDHPMGTFLVAWLES